MELNATVVPNYFFSFSFEENTDFKHYAEWYDKNRTMGFYLVIGYLTVVFGVQKWMSAKQPFSLRKPLFVWNSVLALFSLLGTLRSIPELYLTVTTFGFYHSVCSNSYTRISVNSYWINLFGLSKPLEFGDTLFIILRKKRLIFLHWYHHVTVLLFSWHTIGDAASTGHWFTNMNYLVHSIMYTYYALRAIRIKVPKSLAMVITVTQIVQMVMGAFVTLYAMAAKIGGQSCAISYSTLYSGVVIYLSYFVLFAILFNKYYIKPQKKANKTK